MANIFLKTCPECAAASTVSAVCCPCGYSFHSTEAQPITSEQDMARQEALYEEYLSARAEQAAEAARVAKHLEELFPHDRQKALEAEKLEVAAQTARAQLVSQRERVAEVSEALKQSINLGGSEAA